MIPEVESDKDFLMEPVKNIKDKWKLVPAFLKYKGLVMPHIDSYNYFISVDMLNIVAANRKIISDVDPQFYVRYINIAIGEPNIEEEGGLTRAITPHECRLRDLTYSAPISADVEYMRGGQRVFARNIPLGRMPVMLRSSKCILTKCKTEMDYAKVNECPLDPGGYFITKGVEKVILMQEQLSKNRMMVETDSKGIVSCSVTSSTHEKKSRTNIIKKKAKVYLRHHTFLEDIPIVIVFKAMGVLVDSQIMEMIGIEQDTVDEFTFSLLECMNLKIFTQEQALQYIGAKARPKKYFDRGPKRTPIDEARVILSNMVLAHIPVERYNFRCKAFYLALMVKRVLEVNEGENIFDCKDFYGNKRFELAGSLISLLFEDLFKKFNSELKAKADKILGKKGKVEPFDVATQMRSLQDLITNGLEMAISTGNWIIKRFRMERRGVTQVLCRYSYISALAQMTKINSQFEKTRKVSGPRSVHYSQIGMICPSDTPEGESCGLIKNLALMSHVTTESDIKSVLSCCLVCGVQDIESCAELQLWKKDSHLVFINGTIIGLTRYATDFVKAMRSLRRQNNICEFVSLCINNKQRSIMISCDGGRICRPFIIVENGQPLVTNDHIRLLKRNLMNFEDFLHEGLIEYLDVNELNDCLTAWTESDLTLDHTHLDIERFTMIGVCAGIIPYANHNQSPRITYQCAMGKQSMGVIGYNQQNRIDTMMYTIVHPQKPLVQTKHISITNFDKLPAGQNATVAVMSWGGYDIEDAIIVNKASLDRGFGRCVVYKNVKCSLKKYRNQTADVLQGPMVQMLDDGGYKRIAQHENLDMDGITEVGTSLRPRQTIINKHSPEETRSPVEQTNKKYKETPISHRGPGDMYAERVMLSTDRDGFKLVKVLLRQTRRPEVGDKFSSRHGQKGVIGRIVNQEDMPFSEGGIYPDIIMNPHGFPSRMTVGKLFELLSGKLAATSGEISDATIFNPEITSDVMMKGLEKLGYHDKGEEMFINPEFGEAISSYIFSGPIYYQKLKHMVVDKMHARSTGPMTMLTRQPTEGRARDGGLRVGEMERDCLIAHGASMLLQERLMISSDAFKADLCITCGLLGYPGWCNYCKSSTTMSSITIPYATKLLFQELLCMGITPRVRLANYCQ